ncbi:hypothetical protein L596_003985 [Steinernema carpocapsae]|uniref:Uncharacterized protein n=1 Tax=Steinernema carpocapsae TaxID=34508 RepID=A0A4U8UUA5_STECR|nr:hypothetical protein L596_003985 [Steinernema carpocapsae]
MAPRVQQKNKPSGEEPHRSRPEKRSRRGFPSAYPAAASGEVALNAPNDETVKRNFPSQRAFSPTAPAKRRLSPETPAGYAPSLTPSLSTNSIFGHLPGRREGSGEDSLAPNPNKNIRVVSPQGFKRGPRGPLGGVIGGNAPNGWKPWSKTADTFSKNPASWTPDLLIEWKFTEGTKIEFIFKSHCFYFNYRL